MAFRASRRRGGVAGVKFVPDHGDLANIVMGLQTQGKVVVFTTGTFDLLHVGHLRCLRDAKSRGDFLVVGLHSDRSVRRHKHSGLPVMPEKERVELLEALDCVDYLTLYPLDSTAKLLLTLKPNIYAMGTDYKATTIPERGTVLSYGGRILIVGDAKKHSSTAILHKVRGLKKLPPLSVSSPRATATRAVKRRTRAVGEALESTA